MRSNHGKRRCEEKTKGYPDLEGPVQRSISLSFICIFREINGRVLLNKRLEMVQQLQRMTAQFHKKNCTLIYIP